MSAHCPNCGGLLARWGAREHDCGWRDVTPPAAETMVERLEVSADDMLYYKGGKRGMPNPVFFENISTLLSEAAGALRDTDRIRARLAEARRERDAFRTDFLMVNEALSDAQDRLAEAVKERDGLKRRLRQLERDARDDASAAADEERWKGRQGDEYGSY